MRQLAMIMVTMLSASCYTGATLPDYSNSPSPLPDLHIKKIELRPTQKQQLERAPSGTTVALARLTYEFAVLVENLGDQRFGGPFYLSVSGSMADFQEYMFSRHFRLNNESQTIDSGQAVTFVVTVELEFPMASARQIGSHYPVRFYINSEGPQNSTGFPTRFIAERSYRNNTYETQVRLR